MYTDGENTVFNDIPMSSYTGCIKLMSDRGTLQENFKMNPRYIDSIWSQRCCHGNELVIVVKNPE